MAARPHVLTPSLSVRIAEHPRSKERIATRLPELAALARAGGFRAMSLRASVVSVASTASERRAVRGVLDEHRLAVSMVTGDLPLAINNAGATRALRGITPYLDLAQAMGSDLIRIMVHASQDVPYLQRAADEAAERGMRLAQQCHWGSLAETVDECLSLMRAVDRRNVGITFEPANLLACGDEHGASAVYRLAPHLFNVYFQNLKLAPESALTFPTRARGPVGVVFLPLDDPAGLDARPMVAALLAAGYRGWFTVHQPCLPGQAVEDAVAAAGRFVSGLL